MCIPVWSPRCPLVLSRAHRQRLALMCPPKNKWAKYAIGHYNYHVITTLEHVSYIFTHVPDLLESKALSKLELIYPSHCIEIYYTIMHRHVELTKLIYKKMSSVWKNYPIMRTISQFARVFKTAVYILKNIIKPGLDIKLFELFFKIIHSGCELLHIHILDSETHRGYNIAHRRTKLKRNTDYDMIWSKKGIQ